MGLYLSQPLNSSSCGAYSLAYYLWETGKAERINDRELVNRIYERIRMGPNSIGVSPNYAHPAKMVEELKRMWSSEASLCLSPAHIQGVRRRGSADWHL